MVTLQKVCLVFTIIGAIVWGILGIFNFNLVTFIFGDGSILSRIVYILVGIAFCFPIISLLKRKINISRNLLFVLAFILSLSLFAVGGAKVAAMMPAPTRATITDSSPARACRSPRFAPNMVKPTKITTTIASIITGVVMLAYLSSCKRFVNTRPMFPF